MGELSERVRIAAPAEVVYDLVDDPARFAEWQPYVTLVTDLAGRPEGIGTSFLATYRLFGRRLLTRWVITAAEHGRLLETTGTTSGGWAHWRFALDPAGDGTMLLTTLDYRLPGLIFSGPVAFVAQAVLRRRLHETIRNLGRLAEREALGPGTRNVEETLPVDDAVERDGEPGGGAPPGSSTSRAASTQAEDDPARQTVGMQAPRASGRKPRRVDAAPGQTDAPPGESITVAHGVGPGRTAFPGRGELSDGPLPVGPGAKTSSRAPTRR